MRLSWRFPQFLTKQAKAISLVFILILVVFYLVTWRKGAVVTPVPQVALDLNKQSNDILSNQDTLHSPRGWASPSVEVPREGASTSVDMPRERAISSVEVLREGASTSVQMPRERASPSVDMPRERTSSSVEVPREVASPSVEVPREGASPSVEAPRERASPSVQMPRERASPSVQMPRERASPSVEVKGEWSSPSAEVYKLYFRLKKEQEDKLKLTHRYQFRSFDQYIDYGEPVSTVSPKPPRIVKRILVWTGFRGYWNPIPSNVRCSHNVSCVITEDRSTLLQSDAVLIHLRDLLHRDNLPPRRLPFQRWISFLLEPPYYTGVNVSNYNGIFNWTATYRQDADVVIPYLNFKQKPAFRRLSDEFFGDMFNNITSSKTNPHFVAYMNSNCYTIQSKRLAFVKDLQKYIHVDTYGKCGTLKCVRNSTECTRTMSGYKFYLSLENGHCRDYVTDKVAQPMTDWYSVPVVMGGADPSTYANLLPPHSYIHTSAFQSTKELADFLSLLDKHPALYEKYHRWRQSWENTRQNHFCQICGMLHNSSLPIQSYRDFIGWYNEDTCKHIPTV